MEHEFDKLPQCGEREHVRLFAGIDLYYTDIMTDSFSVHHETLAHIIQINYCQTGQVEWQAKHGGSVFLNPGDFSLHTLNVCGDSTLHFPTGQYQGLIFSVDLREVSANPPELIAGADVFGNLLREKFHLDREIAFLAGNQQTESIFADFYGQPDTLRLPYQRIKALELFLYLSRMEDVPQSCVMEYPSEQIKIVREIHNRLLRHMEQRITIEELSRQYHINPTTLKAAFKAVYGTSLATHIKEHRIERAAKMLRETNMSIAEIAAAVGYESQSRFSAAFKNKFATLPMVYRKEFQK